MQISFAWLFGIIAGAVILALAIFMATKLTHMGQSQTSAETQKQITVLLNQIETGFQTGQVTTLTLAAPTRIYSTCNDQNGIFGSQGIGISQQSFKKWSSLSPQTDIQNRYLFLGNPIEGNNFFMFSKPLNFPFKVADLIYMTPASTTYCFVNSPSGISQELTNLNQGNIQIADTIPSCGNNAVTVCFLGINQQCNGADITVDYSQGAVEKNNTLTYFSGDSLMYAAIFSNETLYNCQLKRLMERENALSGIYIGKLSTIQGQGCSTSMSSDLHLLQSYTGDFNSQGDIKGELNNIVDLTNKLNGENEIAKCPLW